MTSADLTRCGYRFKVTVEGIPSFLINRYVESQQPSTYNSNFENPQVYNTYNIMLGVVATADIPMDTIIEKLKNVTAITVEFLDCEGNVTDTIVREQLEFAGVGFGTSFESDKPIMVLASYEKMIPIKRQMING